MNCNPFTLGHQYLIEHAASKVDYLYIFVVEEDKSDFCFTDRFNMVKLGTAHLKNVYVVPSGEWVLSYKTLPVYFGKSENRSAKVNAVQDLMIFGKHIANALNIKYRFVGEEPTDMVTKQYNEQMRTILGMFAIQVEEIPRKMIANEVISASRVRKYMKEDKWDEVSKLVPKTTYEYLINSKKWLWEEQK